MSTRVITPEAIASYPTLDKPEAMNEGEAPKYSIALVFPKGTDLSELKAAALQAAEEKFGKEKAHAMIKAKKLTLPFRTDGEEKGYPEGSVFFNARTQRKPTVVSRVPDADGKPTVISPDAVYPGAIVRASLSAFGYDVKGNKGVGFGLNNIQFVRDGERLDGSRNARDEFAADEDAVADLSDLEPAVEDESDGYESDVLADLGV